MEARLFASGGWMGERCRRQHRVFADRAAAAVPRNEPLSLSRRRTLPAGPGAPAVLAGVQLAARAATHPALASGERVSNMRGLTLPQIGAWGLVLLIVNSAYLAAFASASIFYEV